VQSRRAHVVYAIYDRLLGRVVDGMYAFLEDALQVARHYTQQDGCPGDRTPNAAALGLLFGPEPRERQGSMTHDA
jgi:hypothetical protein